MRDTRVMTRRHKGDSATLHQILVLSFLSHNSYQEVAKEYGVNRGRVWYWVKKAFDCFYHSGSVGGDRKATLNQHERYAAFKVVLDYLQLHPRSSWHQLRVFVSVLTNRYLSKGLFTICSVFNTISNLPRCIWSFFENVQLHLCDPDYVSNTEISSTQPHSLLFLFTARSFSSRYPSEVSR